MDSSELTKNERPNDVVPKVLRNVNIGDLVEFHMTSANGGKKNDRFTGYVNAMSRTAINLSLAHPDNARDGYDRQAQPNKDIGVDKIDSYRIVRKEACNLHEKDDTEK